MKLGTAKLCITPDKPVRLCGYATRTGVYDSVKEDIFLRVHLYQARDKQLLFLYGDLIWWGSDFVVAVQLLLEEEYGFAPEEIFLVASHNHSGPPTGAGFIPILETYDQVYAAFLRDRIREVVAAARRDLEPVAATRHDGECCLNVFRRVSVNGRIEMRPNYGVEADRHLTLISFAREDGSPKGCLIHYPCHANISDRNDLQPDYPGVALRLLDEQNPGCVSLFLQGCTADLRPNSVLGNRFTPRGYEDGVLPFANEFAQACAALLAGEGVPVKPGFSLSRKRVRLPQRGLKSGGELKALLCAEDEARRQWAEKVLEKGNRPYEDLELSRIVFGDHLSFYTFGAEVSQFYAAYARELEPGAVCIAYANGMIGYIPTAQQIGEGGYEPEGSAPYFALSGTFVPEIEEEIRAAMRAMNREWET